MVRLVVGSGNCIIMQYFQFDGVECTEASPSCCFERVRVLLLLERLDPSSSVSSVSRAL